MLGYTSGELARRRMTLLRLMPPQDGKTSRAKKCSRKMLVNESDRFGLDTISPRRWIHPMAHVMMIAIRDSKGKARWTTSVFEDVFEKERSSTSASRCSGNYRTGNLEWGVQFYKHLKEL
jgi:hypothetical protein